MSRINERRRLTPNVESLDDRTLLSSLVHGVAHHAARHHGRHAIVAQHPRTLHSSARTLGNAHFRGALRTHAVHQSLTGGAGGRSIAPPATTPQFVASRTSVAVVRAEPTGPGINLDPPAPGLNYGVSTTTDGSQTLARDATAPSPTTVTTTVQSGPGINLEPPGPGLHYGVSIASDGSQTLAR